MPAFAGRHLRLYWGNESPQTLVAGVREKSLELAGEAIDITDDDSAGIRELLDAAQVNTITIPVSGVAKTDRLRADWVAGLTTEGRKMQNLSLHYPNGAVISGLFYLSDYSETGPHDGEATFDATFQNSGPVTYTPASP